MNVTSALESVTIYRDAAVCTRTAAVAPAPGEAPRQIRIVGLPLALGAGSLRAAVRSGPPALRVLDVRAAFDVELLDAIDLAEEQQAYTAARDRHAELRTEYELLVREIDDLQQLAPRFLEPRRGDPPREAPVAAMIELADFVDDRLTPRLARRRALARAIADAAREEELRARRLAEASTAKRTEHARVSRAAVITLSDPLVQGIAVALEYRIDAVRWAPSYRLRLDDDGRGGRLTMRAAIAQLTGEDWRGVTLSLSTASLARRTDKPELRALKIGRAQPEPPRAGWREPPPGLDALFEAYDSARERHDSMTRSRTGVVKTMNQVRPRDEAQRMRRPSPPPLPGAVAGYGGAAPAPAAMPVSAQAPMPVRAPSFAAPAAPRGGMLSQRRSMAMEEGEALDQIATQAGGANEATGSFALAPGVPVPDAASLDYPMMRMVGPDGADGPRGRLVPITRIDVGVHVAVEVSVILALVEQATQSTRLFEWMPLPRDHVPVAPIEEFDYRYDCSGPLDIPSNGNWVTVPVMDCRVGLRPRYVCVPSVEAKVYRTLEIANDTVHALLPGPVDVSAGDQFLLTAMLPAVPPGAATKRLGLGVEESIKVARKTTFKETSGGLLGGSTVLPHEIAIEIDNRLATPVDVEVRERIPVGAPDEKDIKIEEQDVQPQWEAIDEPLDGLLVHGTRRWRVTVPARASTKLVAQFAIRIPADRMLVGGNRRT